MWNPFRRKPTEEPFPKPKWPPIQQLDRVDLVGKRRDGGVDLVIVASQPIDDGPETLGSIRQKVGTYLAVIGSEEFQAEMGHPPRDKTAIIIVCEHPIHPRALATIAQCRAAAAAQGVRLEVRKSSNSQPIPLPEGGADLVQSIQPAAQTDRDGIAARASAVLGLLRSRYGDVHLRRTEDDLRLLQRLHDDGGLRAGQEQELEAVGIVLGEVLAARTPLVWITVEWQGERSLGLQYPGTTVIVFPGSMISKRVDRGERVEFESLFRATVAHVEQLKDDPEYKS
jgi:hypothetical protein